MHTPLIEPPLVARFLSLSKTLIWQPCTYCYLLVVLCRIEKAIVNFDSATDNSFSI
jgi:hypothetical protein